MTGQPFLMCVFLVFNLALAPLASATPLADSRPGDLDPSFDDDGKVTTDFGANDYARAVVVDAAGRLVLVGDSERISGASAALARYLADGALDPSFGTGGKVLTQVGVCGGLLKTATLDMTGGIVVAGECAADVILARFLADGALDTGFGEGGWVSTDLGGYDEPHALAIDATGRIVVAGSTLAGGAGHDFVIARYASNGTVDTSFGAGGKVITSLGAYDHPFAMVLDAAGRIVAAGETSECGGCPSDFALARYLANGTLDPSFGATGTVRTDFKGQRDAAFAVTLDAAGRIVVAGSADEGVTGVNFAVARYLADGTLDPSFGAGGKVTTDLGEDDYAHSVAVDATGNIVVAGMSKSDFALAGYSHSGALDVSFGSGGKVVTDFGGEEWAWGMALYPPERIVVGGYTRSSTTNGYDFAVARYVSFEVKQVFLPLILR